LDFKEQEYIEYDEGIQQTKTTGTQPKKKDICPRHGGESTKISQGVMFETTSRHQMFGSKSQAHRKIGAISGNILTLTDVFAWDNLKNTFNEIQYTEISIDHLEMFALDRCIL
jgi:hypothetical protein